MKRELKNASGQIFLTIELDNQGRWIHANWFGYQTRVSIRQGADTYLEILAASKCPYLLNDNRLVAGPWSQMTDWIAQDWAPRAIAQGLTHFAHVISPESLARLSAQNLQYRIGSSFQMEIFEQAEKAQAWLQQARSITS